MPLATEAEADREYARNVGHDNPDRAWILSDRDCWYPNPFYSGPPVRHPEDDGYDDDDGTVATSGPVPGDDLWDQDIPF